MTTKQTLAVGTGIVIGVCLFVLGYLSYNRTLPVILPPDQEKEILLPLLVVFYGEPNTMENRNKYRYLSVDQIKAILNQAVIQNESSGN